MLSPDVLASTLIWRAVLGHELGHALHRDRPDCDTQCEQAADEESYTIMTRAWSVRQDRAAFEVCSMLTMRAIGQVVEHRNMPGHAALHELHVFQEAHRLQSSCEPVERAR